jgi:hypothetical protein
MKLGLLTTVLLSALAFSTLQAAPSSATGSVRSSIELQAETDRAALQSQKKIDALSDRTRELLEEYRQNSRELESLRAYNDYLERMINAQRKALASLETQLEDVQITQREIIPFLGRMVETLAQFVELDRPFLLEERRQRIEQLRELLDRPDATVAEKYRRVMEAYQIETDYGRTVGAYRGPLQQDGSRRMVDFLRVGRMALFYRSLDGTDAGSWDPESRSWQRLGSGHDGILKRAFAVARKQAAPELLALPLPAPEVRR